MDEPRWIPPKAAQAIHHEQIKEHGGSQGLRDREGLQAALARPRQRVAYGDPDLAELAAVYAHAIARRHSFVDGNKRTAFEVMDVFLRINGQMIDAPGEEIPVIMERMASGEISEEQFVQWVRRHMTERTPG